MPLPHMSSNAGKRANTRGLRSLQRSKRKATPARIGACIATLPRSGKQRFKSQSTLNAFRNIRPTRLSSSLCVIPKHWMRSSKRIGRPSCEPVAQNSLRPHSTLSGNGRPEGRKIFRCLVGQGGGKWTSRTPLIRFGGREKDAVRAGLTWSINNGMVEGHVTKLKLIKRQGYGRVGFPLLRKRVLHAI